MKKSLLLLILIFAVVLPAYSQRVLKDIAQGTDNAYVFGSGTFISGDTLFFSGVNINRTGYNAKYYQTTGTSVSTKKLKYKEDLENHNFNLEAHFHKFNNAIYGHTAQILFKIKNDSIHHIRGFDFNYLLNFFELNNELHFIIYNTSVAKYQFYKITTTNDEPALYHSLDLSGLYGSSGEGYYLNDKYYHSLITYDGSYLIATDGTPEGTTRNKVDGIGMRSFQKIGNKVYYLKSKPEPYWYIQDLWRTQGEDASAMRILTEIDGDTSFSLEGLFKYKDDLYVKSYNNFQTRISKLDTNSLSVTHIANSPNGISEVIIKNNKMHYWIGNNNKLYFYENSGSIQSENLLFSIPDPSYASTNLFVGTSNYYVSQQVISSNGYEGEVTYWVYDGSTLKKITDLVPGLATGVIFNAIGVVGNIFYFSASDSQHGYELWRSDGTVAGTFMLKDINENPASSLAKTMFSVGNYLYFMADDISHGNEIWRTDGTNTVLYADLNGNYQTYKHVVSSSYNYSIKYRDSHIADINSKFYQFTPDGNMKPLNFLPIYYYSVPHEYKNLLYFMGNDGNLWKTDCTIEGTKKAVHLDSTGNGTGYWGVNDLIKIDTLLFFTSNNGSVLWRTNGTKSGTVKLFTFVSGINPNTYHTYLFPYASEKVFYFTRLVNPGTSTYELWASNGTVAGTVKLPVNNYFSVIGTLNSKFYFINDGKLWRSDGTIAGTYQLVNNFFSSGIKLRDKLYLLRSGNNELEYYELGENENLQYLNKIVLNSDGSYQGFDGFYKLDDRFILNLIAYDHNPPKEEHFYITDGNRENIKKAFTLKKSSPLSYNYGFIYHKSKFYFSAVDTLKGNELWIWDFECPDGYTIRDNITKDSTIIYGKNIWGQNIVSNNKTVTYDAKNSITLQPGFEAQRGTVFKTRLIGCANTNTPNSIEDDSPSKNEPLIKVKSSTTYPQLMDFLYYMPNKHLKEIYEQAQQTKLAPVSWDIVTEKDIYRLDLKIGSTVLKGFLPKKN